VIEFSEPALSQLTPAKLCQMSAMGQKRTLFMLPFYVCFTPESGHLSAWGRQKDL
jgi:hypothetical protein